MNNITNHISPPRTLRLLTPPSSPRKQRQEDRQSSENQYTLQQESSPKSGAKLHDYSNIQARSIPSPLASPTKSAPSRPRAETCLTENRNGTRVTPRRALSADEVYGLPLPLSQSQSCNKFTARLLRVKRDFSPQVDGTYNSDDYLVSDVESDGVSEIFSDGASDYLDDDFETFVDPNDRTPLLSPVSDSPENSPCPRRTWRSKYTQSAACLTSPQFSAFPESHSDIDEVTTPLIQASPALDAFPFPPIRRKYPSLSALPNRFRSSPLRQSQWLSRGKLSLVAQTPSRTPDRFIPARRSPNSSTESFFTSKPAAALTDPERMYRRGNGSPDPFSRQLRRSSRLASQLRALRLNQNQPHPVSTAGPAQRQAATTVRQVSDGTVWQVGGSSAAIGDSVVGIPTGQGGMLGSGTNAPLYTTKFLQKADPESEMETYERRLAAAFDIDQSSRILGATTTSDASSSTSLHSPVIPRTAAPSPFAQEDPRRPFLDAPQLRDDFYCTLLAYSETAKCVAVGLGNFVHLWSEESGVDTPDRINGQSTSHVTSLAFSSTSGGQAILAVGRADGRITLWSLFDEEPRFEAMQPSPIACVAFRPCTVKRASLRSPSTQVATEELLIGDEAGHVYLYSIEWSSESSDHPHRFIGGMSLSARVTAHTQQVCGIAWSADGEYFATGGNDNTCFLFETKKLLASPGAADITTHVNVETGPDGERRWTVVPGHGNVLSIPAGREKHKWILNAAIKAIAFCPWQRGLVAIGGGSNDRCIHFYHTVSGAGLATIDCSAQVTSLIWSTTLREIAATFGFAQPDHPFRIAVFSWPACEQVVAIPWYDESRALYAIPYPRGPNVGDLDGDVREGMSRANEEGCIIVAASDAAIRFHEVWSEEKTRSKRRMGILGGSDILENFHGIEKEGPEIR